MGQKSLPARGAWIETPNAPRLAPPVRRSPRGERGLKLAGRASKRLLTCRSPRGERGLKRTRMHALRRGFGRSPRGERGLKRADIIDPLVARVAPDRKSVVEGKSVNLEGG